ncbi:MAG: hypothetical protein ACHQC8_02290 [Solirubrobacterales bacterium]
MHRRPSPATAISLLALFFALGGTAIAAKHYLITSTSQIKPSVLKQLHGKAGETGPAGAAGAAGPAGPQGSQGPAGPSNLSGLTSVTGPTIEVPVGKVEGAEATCPAGSHAVSGGGSGSIAGIDVSEMGTGHQSWFIIIYNESAITLKIHAEAQCAGAGQAVAASVGRSTHAHAAQHVHQLVAELTAEKTKAGKP